MGVGRKFTEAGGDEGEEKEEEDECRLLVGRESDYHELMFNFIKKIIEDDQ